MPEIKDGMRMDLERANMDKLRSVFPECFAEGKGVSYRSAGGKFYVFSHW